MSNHFILINSNGGYIGRYYWANTDFHHPDPDFRQGWGQMYCMPNLNNDQSPSISYSQWAGSIWVLRAWLEARSC